MQSAVIVSLGLLEPQELARFAPETRDAITVLSKAIQPHRGTQK